MNKRTAPGPILAIDKAIETIFKWCSYIGGAALVFVAFFASADIVSTKLLNKAINDANAIVEYLLILEVYLVVARVQLESGLMSVDLLTSRFSSRLKKIISVTGIIIGAVMYFLSGYFAVNLFTTAYNTKQLLSGTLNSFVRWPFILVFVVGTFLLVVSFIWRMVRLLYLDKFKSPEQPSQIDEDNQNGEEISGIV